MVEGESTCEEEGETKKMGFTWFDFMWIVLITRERAMDSRACAGSWRSLDENSKQWFYCQFLHCLPAKELQLARRFKTTMCTYIERSQLIN